MMTRNPSKRRALMQYALALPIFILLASFLATPDNIVLKKTADLSSNIENFAPEQLGLNESAKSTPFETKVASKSAGSLTADPQKNLSRPNKTEVLLNETFDVPNASQSMPYESPIQPLKEPYLGNKNVAILKKDTTERPYSELNKIDPNTIERIEVNKHTEDKITILVIFKDKRVEKFLANSNEFKGGSVFSNNG
ncbi:MAG: hypothetical protein HC817_12635, partial [Saprospiraceae bacterium]|nr:hypothetical protein [Saprospiraceae bacterium]